MMYEMTIFIETLFLVILGAGTLLGVAEDGWGKSIFSLTFWNISSMGFPMVYGITILNEHPFLFIFEWDKKWVGQIKFFYGLKTLH